MAERLTKMYYWLSALGLGVGSLALMRSYLSGDKYRGEEEVFGKTVIITGANRGIGKETAKELSKRGILTIESYNFVFFLPSTNFIKVPV